MVRFDRCGWGREGQEREYMEVMLVNCAGLSLGSELGWGKQYFEHLQMMQTRRFRHDELLQSSCQDQALQRSVCAIDGEVNGGLLGCFDSLSSGSKVQISSSCICLSSRSHCRWPLFLKSPVVW